MYGLDIVRRSGGSLRRGTVYVTLSRMEDRGLVEGLRVAQDHGLPRRAYRVTHEGRQEFLHRHVQLPRAVVVSE